MEYDDKNEPISEVNATTLMLALLTERQNEASRAIAELRSAIDLITLRLDEAEHMTSEEYGQQVVQQIMNQMPTIQAAAMKQAKRGARR